MGREGFEPSKPKQQIYSLPPLTTREPPRILFNKCIAFCQIRTDDPEITSHVLWPAELRRQKKWGEKDLNLRSRSNRFTVCPL